MRPTFIVTAASVAAVLVVAGPAWAQANRTFVSGQGSDSNPCSLAAPCRSFAQAITQTNPGGEIAVLDTAGYGAVTITKSVTITNPGGVEAGVTATGSQSAIQIQGGSSSINVTLRGLTLQGASGGTGSGIDWAAGGGTLNVLDCVTKDFGGNGIVINPASGSPLVNVTISKTTVLNNGDGIVINTQAGASGVNYSISHTITNANLNTGISVIGGTVSGSISFAHSEMNGIGLSFNPTNLVSLTMNNSVLRNNGVDAADGNTAVGSTLYLDNANTIGSFSIAPGSTIKSDGTNNVISITGGGSLTKVTPQ